MTTEVLPGNYTPNLQKKEKPIEPITSSEKATIENLYKKLQQLTTKPEETKLINDKDRNFLPKTFINWEDSFKNLDTYYNPERITFIPLLPYIIDITDYKSMEYWNSLINEEWKKNYMETHKEKTNKYPIILEALKENQIDLSKKTNILTEVRIASKQWWNIIEKMAMSPIYKIKHIKNYLTICARSIESQLPIKIFDDDNKNQILNFAFWYFNNFDQTTIQERIHKGYDNLINALKCGTDLSSKSCLNMKDYHDNPFVPSGYIPSYDEQGNEITILTKENLIGPKKITIKITLNDNVEHKMEDFFRNLTDFTRNNNGNITRDLNSGFPEVRPPPSMKYSWVPEEYRDIIYKEYNIQNCKYLETSEFTYFFLQINYFDKENDSANKSLLIKKIDGKPILFLNDNQEKYWAIKSEFELFNATEYLKENETETLKFRETSLFALNKFNKMINDVLQGDIEKDEGLKKKELFLKYFINIDPAVEYLAAENKRKYVTEFKQEYLDNMGRKIMNIYYKFKLSVPLKFVQIALIYNFAPFTDQGHIKQDCKEAFLNAFWNYLIFYDEKKELVGTYLTFPVNDTEYDDMKALLIEIYSMGSNDESGCPHIVERKKKL